MALSEQEQRMLDEMERSLYDSDADIVSPSPSGGPQRNPRNIVLGVLIVIAGLSTVISGVVVQLPLLGALGFILMFSGVLFALRRNGKTAPEVLKLSSSNGNTSPSRNRQSTGTGFMDRLNENWERRQNGNH